MTKEVRAYKKEVLKLIRAYEKGLREYCKQPDVDERSYDAAVCAVDVLVELKKDLP